MTNEDAIEMYNAGAWINWTPEEIVRFQLFEKRLVVPMNFFKKALATCLGRPIYTHDLIESDQLQEEFLSKYPK